MLFLPSFFLCAPGAPQVSAKDLFVVHAPGSPCQILEGKAPLLPDGTTQTFPTRLPDGTLLFSSNRTGDTEIYLRKEGKSLRLTHSPGSDDCPAPSPDGKEIFFVSDQSGNREVWRMEKTGGRAERVTRFGAFTTHPLPLSNGDVVVSSNKDHPGSRDPKVADGRFDLLLLDGKGRLKKKLTDGPGDCSSPTLLSDGGIAYASNETGRLEIFVLENGKSRRITDGSHFEGTRNVYAPVFLPNGHLLVSVHEIRSKSPRLATREFRYVALLDLARGRISPLTDPARCDASTKGF